MLLIPHKYKDSLIVEELNVDSLIIAELFMYIEEKYDINIEQVVNKKV